MRTYIIIKREYAEKQEYAAGMLGAIMDHSKQRALDKASKRYSTPKERLVAYYNPE